MKIYKVGGAVRDGLLNIPVQDQDWVVIGSTPEELLKLGYKKIGKDFPVFLHPETHEEYALARTERKTGPGYAGFDTFFSPDVTLEEDLARRDFTINAMALDQDGEINDPFCGQEDLKKEILRHVTEAFSEDPLRVIRGARFCAKLNFTVSPKTIVLMRKIAFSGELSSLKKERLWREVQKVLETFYPQRFFEVLEECDALTHVFPEIASLFEYDVLNFPYTGQSLRKHIIDSIAAGVEAHLTPPAIFALLAQYLSKTPYPNPEGTLPTDYYKIDTFCDSIRTPALYKKTAINLAKINPIPTGDKRYSASALISLFENTDAYRNPSIFKESLSAYIVEEKLLNRQFTNRCIPPSVIVNTLEASAKVDTSEFVMRGLRGLDFAKEIRGARFEKIFLAL